MHASNAQFAGAHLPSKVGRTHPMTESTELLRNEKWLLKIATVCTVFAIALGVAYFCLSARLSSELLLSFLGTVVFSGALSLWLIVTLDTRKLRTFQQLAPSGMSGQFVEAAVEVRQAADVGFENTFICGFAFFVLTASLWRIFSDVSIPQVLRLGFDILICTIVTAVARYNLIQLRSRALLAEMVPRRVPFETLAQALPPMLDLKKRAALFVAIMAVAPHMVLWDLLVLRFWAGGQLSQLAARKESGLVNAFVVDSLTVSLGLAAFLLFLAVAFLSCRVAVAPLRQLGAVTQQLVNGDTQSHSLVLAESEVWEAAKAVHRLDSKLASLAFEMGGSSSALEMAVGELSKADRHYREGASSQTTALLETSATTEELAHSARSIAETSLRVSELAQQTLGVAQDGTQAAIAFVVVLNEVTGKGEAVADSVVRLNTRMVEIEKVVEFIQSIADRSDLLSLNAELEAFKVGEAGRGFGLIAIEMRRLAENIVLSTQAIVRLVNDIRDATEAAVMATEAGVKAGRAGADLAHQVQNALAKIVSNAEQSAAAMQTISMATVQQQVGTDQLAKSMAEVLDSTKSGLQAVEQMAEEQRMLLASCKSFATTLQEKKA